MIWAVTFFHQDQHLIALSRVCWPNLWQNDSSCKQSCNSTTCKPRFSRHGVNSLRASAAPKVDPLCLHHQPCRRFITSMLSNIPLACLAAPNVPMSCLNICQLWALQEVSIKRCWHVQASISRVGFSNARIGAPTQTHTCENVTNNLLGKFTCPQHRVEHCA